MVLPLPSYEILGGFVSPLSLIFFICKMDIMVIAPILQGLWVPLIAQLVKNLPAMQQTQVQFLGWEDPLEKEVATHSSILAQRKPWTEEPGRLQSMGSQE